MRLDAETLRKLEREGLESMAVPLDEWCERCTVKLATTKSKDGVGMCEGCAKLSLIELGVLPANRRDARRRANAARAVSKNRAGKKKRKRR